MKRLKLLFTMLMLAMSAAVFAQEGTTVELWPNGAPNASSDENDKAELTVYLPDAKKATGRAVVCCPGGGYTNLAMDHEGHQWAAFFNNQGIALIVLKYRMPHGNRLIPISDAEEAIKTVRRRASEWHINPADVGIMGFSAGGHLASTIATHSTGDAAPNFQILFYPVITMDPSFTHHDSMKNFFGGTPKKKDIRDYSSDQQVSRVTPRTFIALSDDDDLVLPMNGANFYMECYRHDVPASLHVFPSGGHGWGMRDSFEFHVDMLICLRSWLNSF